MIEVKDLELIANLKDLDSVLIDDSNDGVAKRATISKIKQTINAVEKNEIIQTTGTSTTKLMSQKSVTDELNKKADLTKIPSKTSDIINDLGFLVSDDIINKANKSEIPTKTSQLTNDINFVNQSELAKKVDKESGKSLVADAEIERLSVLINFDNTDNDSRLTNLETESAQQKTDIANKQDKLIAGANISIVDNIISANVAEGISVETDPVYLADKPDIALKSELFSGDYNDLINIPTIEAPRDFSERPVDLESEVTGILPIENVDTTSLFSGNYEDLNNKPKIPEGTDDLVNTSGFITLDDIPEQVQKFNVMFIASKNSQAIITHDMPTENQVILPSTWFPSNPSQWYDILTIEADESVEDSELEFVPGSKFAAKIWVRAAMARNNAQIRMSAIDKADGVVLASATTIVNLPNNTPSPIPVAFENIHQELRVVKLKDIQIIISVNTPEYSIQLEIVGDVPNEICYIVHNSVIESKSREFTENPIDLESEVTGVLPVDNINVDSLLEKYMAIEDYDPVIDQISKLADSKTKVYYGEDVSDEIGNENDLWICLTDVSYVFDNISTGQEGTVQKFLVPFDGVYRISAMGAMGSVSSNARYPHLTARAGYGAKITADFQLSAGDVLKILVGQKGSNVHPSSSVTDGVSGAAGGGTFVFKDIDVITDKRYQFTKGAENFEVLLVAAGGGGTNDINYQNKATQGADGNAVDFKSPDNYIAPNNTTFSKTSSGSNGSIAQYITNNGVGAYYSRNGFYAYGGYGGGGATDDSPSSAGGWSYTSGVAQSWSSGDNTVGVNGVSDSHGQVLIVGKKIEIYKKTSDGWSLNNEIQNILSSIDSKIDKKSDIGHVHIGSDIIDGVISPEILPIVNDKQNGIMTPVELNQLRDLSYKINSNPIFDGVFPVMLFEKTDNGFIRNEDGTGDHILVSTPSGGYNLVPFANFVRRY